MTSNFCACCFRRAGMFYTKGVLIKYLSKIRGIWRIALVSSNKNPKMILDILKQSDSMYIYICISIHQALNFTTKMYF